MTEDSRVVAVARALGRSKMRLGDVEEMARVAIRAADAAQERLDRLADVADIKVVEVFEDGSAHLWSQSRNLEWDAPNSSSRPPSDAS
jgi:hypothetical protein